MYSILLWNIMMPENTDLLLKSIVLDLLSHSPALKVIVCEFYATMA